MSTMNGRSASLASRMRRSTMRSYSAERHSGRRSGATLGSPCPLDAPEERARIRPLELPPTGRQSLDQNTFPELDVTDLAVVFPAHGDGFAFDQPLDPDLVLLVR